MHIRNVVGFALLISLSAHAQEENAVAVVHVVEGKVMTLSGSVVKEATEGQAVFPGTKFQVQPGAKLKITFDDDNTITIGEDSEFDVSEYDFAGHVLMKLWRGAVEIFVRKKYDGNKTTFQLETKSAVVGVRGTEYTVQYTDASDETSVNVLSGEVEMGRKREGYKIVAPDFVKPGFGGHFKRGTARALVAKFDAVKLQAFREKLRPNLPARHPDVLKKWRDSRKDLLKKRGLWRDPAQEKAAPLEKKKEARVQRKDERKNRRPNSVFSKGKRTPIRRSRR